MGSHGVPGESSIEFAQALKELRVVQLRPEVRLTEVPAPSRIAPYAVALTAEVASAAFDSTSDSPSATASGTRSGSRSGTGSGTAGAAAPDEADELASGRFVLLYDPSAPEPWDGVWRAVTFARAELEPELAVDPLLGAVGWSWLVDALALHGADYLAEGGTVTRVVSESFAGLEDRKTTVEMEIRASWTPIGPDLGIHLQAWADLLCTIAGLPPLPDGVVALPGQRR